jgi:hypothetical protein
VILAERETKECIEPCMRTVIEYGNRRLSLSINTVSGKANESVRNIEGLARVEGSMTKVHTLARSVMQEAANRLGKPIYFEFSTFPDFGNKMIPWALDPQKGKAVFDWDVVKKPSRLFPLFTAEKTFYPKEQV